MATLLAMATATAASMATVTPSCRLSTSSCAVRRKANACSLACPSFCYYCKCPSLNLNPRRRMPPTSNRKCPRVGRPVSYVIPQEVSLSSEPPRPVLAAWQRSCLPRLFAPFVCQLSFAPAACARSGKSGTQSCPGISVLSRRRSTPPRAI